MGDDGGNENGDGTVRVDLSRIGDGVAVLTIDRTAKKNALSAQLRTRLAAALAERAADERCRVTVLTAAGDLFGAGFDLHEFGVLDERTIWSSADALHRALLHHPVPVIAALEGPAYAGSADLAVMADLRIGTPRTLFAHPERLRYPVVFAPLAAVAGPARAAELALTGRQVDADEALRLGLLTEVVDTGATARAIELAADIARAPRPVLTAMKAKMIRGRGVADVTTLEM
ncbi:enoyl-CoA hydratase/isomerase family protein [Sediminivirga luteola]|uniref:enoyl-CoA hydratase/isomerase family protein n=1 Tax=Sediminivirga luteola TaxID=1774748 RepID=UPI001F57EAD0|nr:enoyl-CoA hydratase/isomerase family protein [Sediminivirga luteola]MCI2266355.1 enoyl-CoA hydratase/isomerase family protein [Sediminivirga luteola]